jgi:2'-5' RNA ligase
MRKGMFVGVPIAICQATKYSNLVQQLWHEHQYIQWFHPYTLHCTLAYVDISRSKRPTPYLADAIKDVTKKVVQAHPQLSVTFNQFEWFGISREILVVTSSPHSTNSKLAKLARYLQRKIRSSKLPVVQLLPFRAHISFGRQHPDRSTIYSSPINAYPSCKSPLQLDVSSINIYESLDFHEYKVWHSIPLPLPKDKVKECVEKHMDV